MSHEKETRFAITRYLVDKLKDVGKTKIQKLVYFLQYAFDVPLDYVFRMHYYGPYSEELDDDLIEMKLHRYIDITPDPAGCGYHIQPGSEFIDWVENTTKPYAQQLNNCFDKLGGYNIQELELLGTLHFVQYLALTSSEGKGKDQIVDKVATLKPVFDKSEIERFYEVLQDLVNAE